MTNARPTVGPALMPRFLVSVVAGCALAALPVALALPPLSAAAQVQSAPAATQVAVVTYHNDTFRTGWNAHEQVLTPASVASPAFQLLHTVLLDDKVEAQPLVVPGQTIGAQGSHDVVYVVTASNSIYAIDTGSGAVLLSVNLGPPVPLASLPGTCVTAEKNFGIDATPVIDVASQTMYVIAFTDESGTFVYRLHALDLATLTDKVPPVVVAAQQKLSDGATLSFPPAAEHLRAALLETKTAVYAGFSSFCDIKSDVSRGWVLGWQLGTLAPLAGADLIDRLPAAPNNVFLSSVWMSGAGMAADASGNLFFVTGNSDQSGLTYNSRTNLAESVVRLSPTLAQVQDYFTPSGAAFGVGALDKADNDFGAGGILLLPAQPGAVPRMAVAAGKVGQMYLLNRDSLGHYVASGPDKVLASVPIGPCWCAESFFTGPDGVARIVSSGGSSVTVWKLQTTPSPTLVQESVSAAVASRQNHGFFTAVSSNGTKAGTAVVWAAAGPPDTKTAAVTLYAYNAADVATPLLSVTAGNWPYTSGAAHTVPVVANAQVYVASYKQLAIFGLSAVPAGASIAQFPPVPQPPLPAGQHAVFGVIRSATPDRIVLATRDGTALSIDPRQAARSGLSVAPVVGRSVQVRGAFRGDGWLAAAAILQAPDLPSRPELWPADR